MPYRFTPWIDIIRELLGTLVGFLFLWMAPISNYLYLVVALILIDMITGTYASIKEGQKWSAKRMGKTIEKFLFYSLTIISAYVVQRIMNDGNEIPRIVALYIGATELKSIFENTNKITHVGIFSLIWDMVKLKIDSLITGTKKDNE